MTKQKQKKQTESSRILSAIDTAISTSTIPVSASVSRRAGPPIKNTSCRPDHLILLTLVPKVCIVTAGTLRRAIKDKRLIEYRDVNNAVMVDIVEVRRRWPKKK